MIIFFRHWCKLLHSWTQLQRVLTPHLQSYSTVKDFSLNLHLLLSSGSVLVCLSVIWVLRHPDHLVGSNCPCSVLVYYISPSIGFGNMIDIEIQISISDRSSGWAFNYICRCQSISQHFPVSLILWINVPLTFNQNIHYPSALSIYVSVVNWSLGEEGYFLSIFLQHDGKDLPS